MATICSAEQMKSSDNYRRHQQRLVWLESITALERFALSQNGDAIRNHRRKLWNSRMDAFIGKDAPAHKHGSHSGCPGKPTEVEHKKCHPT